MFYSSRGLTHPREILSYPRSRGPYAGDLTPSLPILSLTARGWRFVYSSRGTNTPPADLSLPGAFCRRLTFSLHILSHGKGWFNPVGASQPPSPECSRTLVSQPMYWVSPFLPHPPHTHWQHSFDMPGTTRGCEVSHGTSLTPVLRPCQNIYTPLL